MKKQTVKLLSYMMVIALPLFVLNSCKKDPCKDVECKNGGTPTEDGDDCKCVCAVGYEGSDCGTLVRAKFIGTHNANETCTSGNDVYSITINAVTSDDKKVQIVNLYNAGISVNGEVNADGGITIPNQPFGSGIISGTISATGAVSYTVTAGGLSDGCSFTITL
jgi:hypothetical protein